MVRRTPVAAAVCVASLLAAPTARAGAPQAPPPAGEPQQAFLEITVNGVPKGDALVWLRGADVFVAAATLSDAGLDAAGGARERIGGEELVSLASLAPAVTFAVEEQALRLAITARADLLGRTVYDFRAAAPRNIVYARAPSAFVNYALRTTSRGDSELFTESALSAGGALLSNTLTTTPRATVRGLTSLTVDERRGMRRWIAGDAFAATGILGGSALVGGLTIARDFSLEPYFVRFPSHSVTEAIDSPSIVEVYVNDRMVSQQRVEPGLVDLQHLPLAAGQNQARVVVRDAFGAAREVASGVYVTAATLAPGLHDYQYSVGFRRTALGVLNAAYGPPVALARHRVGLTSWLTAGARLEADRRMLSGGATVNLALPFGEIEAAAGRSRTSPDGADALHGAGSAFRLSYQYVTPLIGGGVTIGRTSPAYATASLTPGQWRAEEERAAFISMPLPRVGSLSLHHSDLDGVTGRRQQTSLTASIRLFSRTGLIASAARLRTDDRRGFEATLGMSVNLGRRTLGIASVSRTPERRTTAVAELQRSVPLTTGTGFTVRADTGGRSLVSGSIEYQGSRGRYDARLDAGDTVSVSASGALVAIGGGLHMTRPIRNSFALVQVPGVRDVRAYASYQEVGRTDRGGNLLVTDLYPYYANELSIADTDVPLEYEVGRVNVQLAPPFRGGAIVTFPVHRVRRITGRVLLVAAERTRIPAYGELEIAGGAEPVRSPIGADGQFYFDSLASGRHEATVRHGGDVCRFTLVVPDADSDLLDVGETRCVIDRP
jgi:outer membrane usher protein